MCRKKAAAQMLGKKRAPVITEFTNCNNGGFYTERIYETGIIF